MTVKLSPLVGSFNSDILQYMTNLKVIDLSGCTTVKADDFVATVVDCKNLTTVVMQSCPQFSKWQFVKIGTSLPKLYHFDLQNSKTMLSVNAFQIVTTAKMIKNLLVEPNKDPSELKNWCQLKATFLNVNFGQKVRELVAKKT